LESLCANFIETTGIQVIDDLIAGLVSLEIFLHIARQF
jgi:hypothetical protein